MARMKISLAIVLALLSTKVSETKLGASPIISPAGPRAVRISSDGHVLLTLAPVGEQQTRSLSKWSWVTVNLMSYAFSAFGIFK